jgi:GNAT superfamily N-acetyltransferase
MNLKYLVRALIFLALFLSFNSYGNNDINYIVRDAGVNDNNILYELIRELAIYEKKKPSDIEASAESLKKDINKYFKAKIIEASNKKPIAYALYFYTYSAFRGKPVLYVEDIFVLPEYRGKGVGSHLLKTLAKEAVSNQCSRMEWHAFDWNTKAIDFYESLGAYQKKDLIQMRLEGERLYEFGKQL